MKKRLLPILFFILANCSGQITPAQLDSSIKAGVDPYFVASKDTISKYGPDCITRDIIQDRNGNFWLASWHGIIKYDGKIFTNYTLKENLKRFHVRSLYEDKKGNIWFGTARGGLYKYNPSAEAGGNKFTPFTTTDGLADNTVACITEDNSGTMWFGTEGGGISCYDGKKFSNFTTKHGLPGNTVNSIMQDKKGIVWIGTMEGTCCFNPQTKPLSGQQNLFVHFNDGKGQPIKRVLSIFEDTKGYIWIGIYDGLIRYNPALAQSGAKAYESFLLPWLTYYFTEDKSGNLWFTQSEPNKHYTDLPSQVLYSYDGKIFSRILTKYGPYDFQIFGKVIDKNGNLWFGTMRGLCKYTEESGSGEKTFKYFTR